MRHLVELIRDVADERDFFGAALLTLLGLAGCVTSLVPLSTVASDLVMARFHRRGSFYGWALFQPLPSMYNFRNRVWIYLGPRPAGLPVDGRAGGAPAALFRYVNHHSYRAVGNPLEAPLPSQGCLTTVLVSDYRNRWLRTEYRVCRVGASEFRVLPND